MHDAPIYTSSLQASLRSKLEDFFNYEVVVICDSNTYIHCLPHLDGIETKKVITIEAGEKNKSFKTYQSLCEELIQIGAGKNTLLIALGGGVVSDLTGLAASTYKRGIPYINIPTSLLAMVDASLGGKTAINLNGVKNVIGSFYFPEAVMSSGVFLETLPKDEWLNGFGEVVKHALILNTPPPDIELSHVSNEQLLEWSLVKYQIVSQDPNESHLRYILNAGHTIGHALESWALLKGLPLSHGSAVALGLFIESYISKQKKINDLHFEWLKEYIPQHFGRLTYANDDIPAICDYLQHDKKKNHQALMFSFIGEAGELNLEEIEMNEVVEALEWYQLA